MRTWPSRRLQIIAIIILVFGAALRVFCPPLTREGRAEKLYTDSWFVGGGNLFDQEARDDRNKMAVSYLEKALKLSPGNSMYEQALVWQWDRDKLPQLMSERHFGPDARRLAAGLIAQGSQDNMISDDPAEIRESLERQNMLAKADPTNSLAHYRKAYLLQQLGQDDVAYAELKIANRLGPYKMYLPQFPSKVLDSVASPMLSLQFADYSKFRRLVMAFTEVANDRLRQGDVRGACETQEQCLLMAVNVAASQPHNTISVLVGWAMQIISEKDLKPTYKDFGMKDELARLRRLDAAFDRARKVCIKETGGIDWERQAAMSYAVPVVLTFAMIGAPLGAIPFALFLIPAVIIRRRRSQDVLRAVPWGEGFLVRVFLSLYIPLLSASIVVAHWWPEMLFPGDNTVPIPDFVGPLVVIATGLINVLVIGLVLRVLHHRYDEQTGERISMLRFIFRAPANVKVWTRKYLIAALGAQIIFVVCCSLLATIVYKPIFGGHPWETNRFCLISISHEQATMKVVAEDILKSSLAAPEIRAK